MFKFVDGGNPLTTGYIKPAYWVKLLNNGENNVSIVTEPIEKAA